MAKKPKSYEYDEPYNYPMIGSYCGYSGRPARRKPKQEIIGFIRPKAANPMAGKPDGTTKPRKNIKE